MRVAPHELDGLRVLEPRRFADDRGWLQQAWVASDLATAGIAHDFRQSLLSHTHAGVVRGMHFQWAPMQGKLVRCVAGAVFDVVVDVRHGSSTLGRHAAVDLSAQNGRALWIPPGFAHGFQALVADSVLLYECTAEHGVGGEGGIRWDDPALGIAWPSPATLVSPKDAQAPTLAAWLADPRSRAFRVP